MQVFEVHQNCIVTETIVQLESSGLDLRERHIERAQLLGLSKKS